jgi:ribosomal protein S15
MRRTIIAPRPPDAVGKRRRLLDYLKTKDVQRYSDLIRKLNIRK